MFRMRFRKALINAFIVANIAVLLVWDWPKTSPLSPVARLAAPYLNLTGLSQSWPMFAWPRTFNFHVVAAVTFADGSTDLETLPWEPGAGAWTRYRRSRSCLKFLDAVGLYGAYPNPLLWRDYARYLARSRRSWRSPPRLVTLTCYWNDIPPPSRGFAQDAPPEIYEHVFFSYRVEPGDLL